MNKAAILTCDCANGTGMRVTLFVSGCTNHCEGCFQPETWDFGYGEPFTQKDEDFIIGELEKPYYEGLTLLGGEPFEPENQRGLIKLLRRVRKERPGKTIWAFTGFTLDKDLVPGGRKHTGVTDEMLSCIDILVDGRFVLSKKQVGLAFRGSSNQRIIDMERTRKAGYIVLSDIMKKDRTYSKGEK